MPGKNRTMKYKSKYTLGSKIVEGGFHDLELPSGATCQARRPGVQGLIAAGLLDSFDDLTALVQTEHVETKSTKPPTAKVTPAKVAATTQAVNKEQLHAALLLMDRLTVYVINEPKVWLDYPLKEELGDDGEPGPAWVARENEWKKAKEAYDAAEATEEDHDVPPPPIAVREVEIDDKMYLLQWAVGGSADLKAFRQESQALLGGLAAI